MYLTQCMVWCYYFPCRSESPSQVFLITIQWLLSILKNLPESEWEKTVLAYDNMCHLDGLRAAQEDLPLLAPFNKMWFNVTKIIDSLHIKNHKDPKCQLLYNPKRVKEENPHFNLMCAEQTFAWLSRFKRICSAMDKTHHCFFLHRMVKRRNMYTSLCMSRKMSITSWHSSYTLLSICHDIIIMLTLN